MLKVFGGRCGDNGSEAITLYQDISLMLSLWIYPCLKWMVLSV